MPRPVSSTMRYLPGLDGLRAIAVALVLAYHLGAPGFEGGLLGVGMFFTLSGYLITTILLRSRVDSGGVDLRRFWRRRFRRLLPAVVLVLAAVLGATVVAEPSQLPARLRESLTAMLYVNNWAQIADGFSYFEQFAGPGPLDHLWSLAVEEQFYLVWPIVLLGMLRAFRGNLSRTAAATLALAAASFVLMAVLAEPGLDNTRAYEGTDTRAGGILLGAAVAMIWRPDLLTSRITPRARLVVDVIGVASLAVVVAVVAVIDPVSLALYRGGILALSVATALLVAVVVHPASRLAVVLGVRPLTWIGARSYGIYLWHLPVISFTPAGALSDRPLLRGSLQVATTVALAAASWRVLEDPVRRHGIGVLVSHPSTAATSWRPRWTGNWRPPALQSASVLAVVATVALATIGLLGGGVQPLAIAEPGPSATAAPGVDTPDQRPEPIGPVATADQDEAAPETPAPSPTPGPSESATTTEQDEVDPETTAPSPTPEPPDAQPATSCTSVVHLGDSTSTGLVDADYLPDTSTRLDAQYAEVGVETFHAEIDGAMSTIERYLERPNAVDRMEERLDAGFDGCWVVAMGTNEAANVAAGSKWPYEERIGRVMELAGDRPAMWLSTKTLIDQSPWRDTEMQSWNEALLTACDDYDNMRIYDWRSEVQDDWYIDDGIHYSSAGNAQRARRSARALARAFPADGPPSSDCVVDSGV